MRGRLLVVAMVTVSCGAKVAVDGAPSGSGGSGGAPCGNAGMPVPAVFKACDVEGDCTIAFTHLDCCGTPAMVGVATLETAAFHAYEARCNPDVPPCNCEPGPAHLDDGSTTMNAGAVLVTCDEGQCTTHVQ